MASLTGGRLWIAGVVISAVALWAPDAGAGLFRCTRPDGRVVYTDNQAACPGAAPHEPTGTVQHIESAPAALRSARPRAIRGSAARVDPDVAREARWRAKKRDAETSLTQVAATRAELLPFLTICNRGGSLYRERESGLRERVTCDSLRSEVASLETREESLREYLDGGLDEECRRAGCLPGWLR